MRIQEDSLILDSLILEIEKISCLETSVNNYRYTLRNSPEEHSYPLLRGRSLKRRCVPGSKTSVEQQIQNNLRTSRRGCFSQKVTNRYIRILNYIIFLHW